MKLNYRTAINSYKLAENDYVRGIETPHGRIQLVFDTILDSLDDLQQVHPKTNFGAFGKCINGLKILGSSLDIENGGDLAAQLVELYDYCLRRIRSYLDSKDPSTLSEVHTIIEQLSESWQEIKP
jgi:flagellar protein FliS